MRKYIVFPILLSLLLGTSPAFSAITAGTKCKSKGAIQISGGKKYTCITKSKKLVWDGGKPLTPSVAPSPTPSATPTPTPTVEPIDTKWYAWSFRYNSSGVLERKQSGSDTWTISPTRKGQVIDPVRLKAWNEIYTYAKTAPRKNVQVNFYFAKNVQPDVEQVYRKYFDISVSFFEARVPDGTTLDVVVGTELDDNFFIDSFAKSLGSTSEANELFQRSKVMIHQFDGPDGKNMSGGGSVSATSKKSRFIYVGAVCSCFSAENVLMYNVAHEVTHYYQQAATPTIMKQNFIGNWPNVTEGTIYIPNSLMEGSANTLGSALIVQHAGWYSDQMDWHLGRYKSRGKLTSITDEKHAVEMMRTTRSYLLDNLGYADLNYGLGELMFEFYIAQYGIVAYFDLFDNIQKYGDFNSALKKTLNISEEDFYAAAAPYVMRAYNSVTG